MAPIVTIETLIETASSLKEALLALQSAYAKLPAIIEKEHKAIKEGQISHIEVTAQEKAAADVNIQGALSSLQDATKIVGSWCERQWPERSRCATLSEVIAVIDELGTLVGGAAFGAEVLRHLLSSVSKLRLDFEEMRLKIQPLLEMNEYLLQNFLQNYRESYIFIMNILEESSAAYNAQGLQETKGRNSGFVIRV